MYSWNLYHLGYETSQVVDRHILADLNNHGRCPSIGEYQSKGNELIVIADWYNGREGGEIRTVMMVKEGVGALDAVVCPMDANGVMFALG